MEVNIGKRNMSQIENAVRDCVTAFQEREDIQTVFGEPQIAYLSTTHPLFDTFFARDMCDHPKNIYRPGNTLILHYVPIDPQICEGNLLQGQPSEGWVRANIESLWLAMDINRVIKDTLTKVGRIHSNTSGMVDWDLKKHRYSWSNKIAGFIAGLGELGPAGSFHGSQGYAGRVGSISTDALYSEPAEAMTAEQLEQVYEDVLRACCFEEADGVSCSDDMIKACPGGAIRREGIDRQKCQDFCLQFNRFNPCPEFCGKCFRFREDK